MKETCLSKKESQVKSEKASLINDSLKPRMYKFPGLKLNLNPEINVPKTFLHKTEANNQTYDEEIVFNRVSAQFPGKVIS